jgi:hypothetical protein
MKEHTEQEEIFSQILRAGRRTYFFDVRATKAGDYYLTVTESKKFTHKHKIYLYKEDFKEFNEMLSAATDYILKEKGLEVISDRHQKDFKKEEIQTGSDENTKTTSFTDVNFEDI